MVEDNDNPSLNDYSSADEFCDEDNDELVESLEGWTANPLHFDGWIGCAAHQLQLVVHIGYNELLNYRRVQAVFSKAKTFGTLFHKSSHFNYALSARIPVPNETRWNSYVRLHEHILKHFDNVNEALNTVNHQNLVLSTSDKENLLKVVDVMLYFAEATNILQADNKPTSSCVIPVIDSLENALISMVRATPAINALCESLLNGLQQHFSYLLDSSIHQSATALDPRIKLTFTDNTNPKNFLVFSSTFVKQHIKSLLLISEPLPVTTVSAVANDLSANGAKR